MADRLPELEEILERLTSAEESAKKLEKYIRILKRAGIDTTEQERQLRELKTRISAFKRAVEEEMR